MDIKYIFHENIKENDLQKVIEIKSISWPYSYENQMKWIESNIKNEDIHVLLFDEKELVVAYLNMIEINFDINGKEYSGYGIGNVCSSKKGNGYASILLQGIKKYFNENKKVGLLFCKENLLDFYRKYEWEFIEEYKVVIKNNNNIIKTMILNFDSNCIEVITYNEKLF